MFFENRLLLSEAFRKKYNKPLFPRSGNTGFLKAYNSLKKKKYVHNKRP